MSVKSFQQEAIYRVKGWWSTWFASTSFLLACAVFLTIIAWKSPVLLFCLLMSGCVVTLIQKIGKSLNIPEKLLLLLQTTAIATILSFFWIDYFSVQAAAQFFGKAEQFFKTSFNNNGADTAVSLVFNILRAFYLLYIAASLVGVINAVRKDEDWQVVARTPLLVVVAVTIADVLTNFIIGPVGGGN
ncbi:MAG: hypothetical protein SAK29_20805 [Scytonema sp. PMC 1069.18]|nr:hypothetical protein [Scytonema sp. PMC 1069.18]MEC4886840.1 hypothetical protein [Scytonema sp. PMC 1070.18]